ncbi:MAG: hypothetical protein ACREH8_20065 [Opitutaceae bacterium]
MLLKAKLYNLASLFWSDRPQDLKHARMLGEIVPHYLNELHAGSRTGTVPEQTLVGAVRYTTDVVTAGYAGNAARAHGLDLQVVPPSVWLHGPPAVQPFLARLKAHGLSPRASQTGHEFSLG